MAKSQMIKCIYSLHLIKGSVHTDYWFPSLQPRFLVMFITGGDSSSADEMYGHAERSYHQPDAAPVIEEVST